MHHIRSAALAALTLLLVAGCGNDNQGASDSQGAPPPAPGLENAATSGPSVTAAPDTAASGH